MADGTPISEPDRGPDPEPEPPIPPTSPHWPETGGTLDGAPASGSAADRAKRPWLERIGLAAIALVLAVLFGAVAAAAISGGELFLGVMSLIGCLMTLWVGILTLVRG